MTGPPEEDALRRRFGPDVPIRRDPPSAAEVARAGSRLELLGSVVGYQTWMWKSWRGRLLALIVVPATISGLVEFWKPAVVTGYEYAAPYVAMAGQAALQVTDELILFGEAAARDGERPMPPRAVLAPRMAAVPLPAAGPAAMLDARLWRITRPQYHPLIGAGTGPFPTRWHSGGTPVIYAAEDALGALAEIRRHLPGAAPGVPTPWPGPFTLHEIAVRGSLEAAPEALLRAVLEDAPEATRAHGDAWLAERRSGVLAVPSRIDPSRRLFLLNPAAPDLEARLLRSTPVDLAADAA